MLKGRLSNCTELDGESIYIFSKNYINKIRAIYSRERVVNPTDRQKIKDLIGILIKIGVNKGR